MALRDDVIEIASKRLELLKFTPPEDITTYVDEVEQAILNYCNISQVPSELKYTWVNMLLDYFRWLETISVSTATSGNQAQSNTPTFISSIREGDTSLGFSKVTTSTSKSSIAGSSLDQITMNYADNLNRFRRLVW